MKKIEKIMVIFVVLICILVGYGQIVAAGCLLNGPGTVRAGDTITLTLNISAGTMYGLEGEIQYDASILTFAGIEAGAAGWKAEISGNKLLAYDDTLSNPLGNGQAVLNIKFNVNGQAATGTAINVSVNNIVATAGSSDINIGNVSYSVSVAPPLSGNNALKTLSVEGLGLTPAFSAGTTTYDLGEVEYDVASLNIIATAEDTASRISISGTSLNVGDNTIYITVTAENGNTKTYSIKVKRKQNPDYVPSSDAALSSIELSQGTLSPEFSSGITDYIVYLPFEATSITATGTLKDSKASGITNGALESMVEGENKMTVIGKAEDGSEKVYTITVIKMPKYEGTAPQIGEKETTVFQEETTTQEQEKTTEEKNTTADETHKKESEGIHIAVVIILMIIAAGTGFAACYILMLFLRRRASGDK